MIGIGKLSTETAVKVPTIRYYEKQGLISEPARSDGNHRLYSDHHIMRLKFIKRSRELGFNLKEVKQLLGLNDGIQPSCQQINLITKEHLLEVNSKIRDLQNIARHLTKLSESCADELTLECPIIESMYGNTHS